MYYSFFLGNSTIILFILIKWMVRGVGSRGPIETGKERKLLSHFQKPKAKVPRSCLLDALRSVLQTCTNGPGQGKGLPFHNAYIISGLLLFSC